jgi:hypothetical protein
MNRLISTRERRGEGKPRVLVGLVRCCCRHLKRLSYTHVSLSKLETPNSCRTHELPMKFYLADCPDPKEGPAL